MTTRTSGYCTEQDLLLGDMPLSSTLSVSKFIRDSADEIDVRLGRLYETPFDVGADGSGPLSRVAILTLKIVNARLASGRLLMAQAQAAQDDSLHAYAMYLLNEAETTLASIEAGRLSLDGADYIGEEALRGPTIRNLDEVSPVQSFYDEFLGGGAGPVPSSPVWRPGSAV